MKQFIALFALLTLPISAHAADMVKISDMPAGVYELDKTHASITWKVSHLGLSDYTARFNTFDAEVDLNPSNLIQSSLAVQISPLSIETDYPNADEKDFDKKLATGEDWFNGGAHPSIAFTSNVIEVTGENTGKITGLLNMLGVQKPVTLDVTFNGAYLEKPFVGVPALGFSATTTIKRSEWGFATYVPNIGDDVDVLIEAEFHKKADATAE